MVGFSWIWVNWGFDFMKWDKSFDGYKEKVCGFIGLENCVLDYGLCMKDVIMEYVVCEFFRGSFCFRRIKVWDMCRIF